MKMLFTAAALTVFSGVIAEAQDIGKGATVFKQWMRIVAFGVKFGPLGAELCGPRRSSSVIA